MIEIRRILCPIDFSDFSRRALDYAVAIARWYESEITVLHVFSTVPLAAYGPGAPAFEPIVWTREDREQLIGEIRKFAEAESAPGVQMTPLLREGTAVAEILAQADEMRADLLIMGTHGRSGFERLFLGSVTEKVLRKARCPVLTVPRQHPEAVPPPPVLFKRILCPLDFSDSSLRALEYALSLAQEADAHLTVLHVIEYEPEGTVGFIDAGATDLDVSMAEFRRQWEDRAARRLDEAVPANVQDYCSVEKMLLHGKPGREILRVAAEQQADLIVIGVQGRGAVDLMVFGSTTQHVVRHATCPVLTLRK